MQLFLGYLPQNTYGNIPAAQVVRQKARWKEGSSPIQLATSLQHLLVHTYYVSQLKVKKDKNLTGI